MPAGFRVTVGRPSWFGAGDRSLLLTTKPSSGWLPPESLSSMTCMKSDRGAEMTEDDSTKRARQRAERLESKAEKLTESGKPRCAICGRSNLRGLEAHHVAGRANADKTIVLCGYCHNIASDGQQDWPDGLIDHGEK